MPEQKLQRSFDETFDSATKEAASFYSLPEMEPASIEVFLEIRYPELSQEDIKIIVNALSD
jgi:hypothetical protein